MLLVYQERYLRSRVSAAVTDRDPGLPAAARM